MAILHGKAAKASVGVNALEFVESWSADLGAKYDDATAMSNTATFKITGIIDGKMTVTCFRDASATQQNSLITSAMAGTAVADMRVYENSTKYYKMTNCVVSFSINSSVGGPEKITFSFENADGNNPTYV